MLYTSTSNSKIKDLKKLQLKKYREQTKTFLVEGEHLVEEAYKAGYLKELFLLEGMETELNVPTSYLTREVLHFLTEVEAPQPVLGVCRRKENQLELGNHILVLDGIQDPGNLGTIIRSAVAFHVDEIVLGNGTVDPFNAKVIRSSQGMIFKTAFLEEDLMAFLPKLKEREYAILGTSVIDGKDVRNIEKMEKFAIIMGNEGNGMQRELYPLCDSFLYIKMNEECESLNVGVATSIILYELDK